MVTIDGLDIGGGSPCRYVAEISNAHNGSESRCVRLVEAAVLAGADCVKFQAYTPDELIQLRGDGSAPEPWGSQGWTMRALYERARTPLAWLPGLFELVRELGAVPFASFFGHESFDLLRSLDCPAYKIAALDESQRHLVIMAMLSGALVIVSTRRKERFMTRRHLALHCPPGYPQHPDDMDFGHFGEDGWWDGFSYHGTSIGPPLDAAARGASLVECHVQLDDEPSDLEAHVSLTISQFREITRSTVSA